MDEPERTPLTTDAAAPSAVWRIRPATVDDVRAIVSVRAAAWADAYGHMVPAAHLAGLRSETVERRWVGHVTAATGPSLV